MNCERNWKSKMLKKKLPIEIENFEDIIKEDFYYQR